MKTDSRTCILNKRNYFVVLVLMVVLSLVFWRSLNITDRTTMAMKVIDGVIVFVSIVILPILFVKIKALDSFVTKTIDQIVQLPGFFKDNCKRIIVSILVFAGSAGIIVGLNWLYDHKVRDTYINRNRVLVFISIVLIAGILFNVRKICYEKAHISFTVIALVMGTLFILVSPAKVRSSWDDQAHYGRTIVIAEMLDGAMYEADAYQTSIVPYMEFEASKESCANYADEVNSLYAERELYDGEINLGVDAVGVFTPAYIPAAVGIILGRGLGLSYTSVFNLGRFFNLLFYTVIMALGIKRLKRGKMLVSAYALMPMLLFLASTYHYDTWLNALVCSGYCYYISAYQDYSNKRIVKDKDMIIAATMIVLGCIPKAVYCPLLIPLFFIPKGFFNNGRKRYYIALSALAAAILLVLTAPYIINSAWLAGDQRAGGDVNSGSQIGFILHNPLEYMTILWNFIKNYTDPTNFCLSVSYFVYFGFGLFPGLWWSILIVLAFIDRDEKQTEAVFARVVGLIMVDGALVLVITALYVSISEVGSPEIRGVQERYLYPLLLPFIWFIARPKATNVSQNKMATICFALLAFIFLSSVYETMVIPY